MSRLNSLKFLLLHKLSKNSSKINKEIHAQIAYSLNISIIDEKFCIKWKVENKNLEIHVDESDFKFYVKSEFDQSSNRNQVDNNERNADKLVLDIIGKSIY